MLGQLKSQREAQRESLTELSTCVQRMEVDQPGPPYEPGTGEKAHEVLMILRGWITHVHQILSQGHSDRILKRCDQYIEGPSHSGSFVIRPVDVVPYSSTTASGPRQREAEEVMGRNAMAPSPSVGRRRIRSSRYQIPTCRPLFSRPWDDFQAEDHQEFLQKLRNRLMSFQFKGMFVRFSSWAWLIASLTPDSDEAPPTYRERMIVHCECALLAHLHDKSNIRPIIPYVGFSKVSCQLCHLYFQCYSAVTGAVVLT